jgi:hypothetical protein
MVLGDVGPNARRLVYAYPRTGRPGEPPLSEYWNRKRVRAAARPRRARSATITRTWLVPTRTSDQVLRCP